MDDGREDAVRQGTQPASRPYVVPTSDELVLRAAGDRVGLTSPAVATEGVAMYVQMLDEHAAVVLRART